MLKIYRDNSIIMK